MSDINPFSDIQLSLSGNVTTVQYRVDSQFKGKAPYRFQLQAYEDNSFVQPLYAVDSNTFFAVDDTNTRQTTKPSFLYKVALITSDNKVVKSPFVGWSPDNSVDQHKYLLAFDIARREQVRFNYTGLYAYLLKRKNYNPAATNDVDPVTGEAVIDSSAGSYGVGIQGGYYSPVLIRLSIENREVKEDYDETGHGIIRHETVATRAAGFPFIDQHDIVVTPDGKRYIVKSPGNKFFPGTTMILLQLSVMNSVPSTDTVYHIPVPTFPTL